MENNLKINGSQLLALGLPEGRMIGLALNIIAEYYAAMPADQVLALLGTLVQQPERYLEHDALQPLAQALIEDMQAAEAQKEIPLNETALPYVIYGQQHIEAGALAQMDVAMRLPVTAGGALMPDAHQGYGLPIGGVLAARNAVIPYGVGVDIGCRMALSIYDIPEQHFLDNEAKYKRELIAFTRFGAGAGWHGRHRAEHEVLDRDTFSMTPFVKNLQAKAAEQLGTSGGGNHFVEWGIIDMHESDAATGVPKGRYLALLSHSGSRGLGATLAGHYTRLAKEICRLPKEAASLAYLGLDTAEGQEYWLAMNLAGDYASACHQVIHERLTQAIGGTLLARVENHHNVAWKETWNGGEVVVHRKGATPAAEGVMGIIPGSMTAPGFLVRGRGQQQAINSASHGAGRQMSRTQAIKSITKNEMRQVLKDHGVTLIGAGLDEAPMAYKDIRAVMAAQQELVDVIATFTPKMVRMADDGSRED